VPNEVRTGEQIDEEKECSGNCKCWTSGGINDDRRGSFGRLRSMRMKLLRFRTLRIPIVRETIASKLASRLPKMGEAIEFLRASNQAVTRRMLPFVRGKKPQPLTYRSVSGNREFVKPDSELACEEVMRRK
jgi:hypothetical protein